MPRTIEVDDDIYEFLQKNVRNFRETESSVLRHLLNLPEPKGSIITGTGVSAARQSSPRATASESSLMRFLADRSFQRSRNATEKFLRILSFAYKQNPVKFETVLEVSGRRRKYFGRSKREIEKSGKSTHPRAIPETGYWAMTNADTRQKCDVLKRTLELLEYSADDIQAAESAIS